MSHLATSLPALILQFFPTLCVDAVCQLEGTALHRADVIYTSLRPEKTAV